MNAVEIQGVSQRYGSMTVLHDLNLTLAEGEVLGLFGHNSAGKTTSMKLILGLLAPSEGRLRCLAARRTIRRCAASSAICRRTSPSIRSSAAARPCATLLASRARR